MAWTTGQRERSWRNGRNHTLIVHITGCALKGLRESVVLHFVSKYEEIREYLYDGSSFWWARAALLLQ